ncbi:hypothetical protein GGS26DRAFT_220598 [Hypomontagnella submonticulosa]|nr:hypothetical protein GGS26DRAFT_220598 [Hypomontagnella submonticulosa]
MWRYAMPTVLHCINDLNIHCMYHSSLPASQHPAQLPSPRFSPFLLLALIYLSFILFSKATDPALRRNIPPPLRLACQHIFGRQILNSTLIYTRPDLTMSRRRLETKASSSGSMRVRCKDVCWTRPKMPRAFHLPPCNMPLAETLTCRQTSIRSRLSGAGSPD